tara:strand:- start:3346 stop:5070 length:1725 start_codon:yes stop_codon:yes gene_type:complete
MSTLVVNRINAKTGSALTVDALVTGSSVQAKGIIAASGSLYAGSLISGSGDLIVAKNAFIAGNLRVTGTVVTDTLDVRVINNSTVTTTTLEVEDKLIIVASGSNSSNTDDAGIQFGGTEGNGPIASILWDHTNQRLSASSALYTGGDVFVDGGDVTVKAGENGAANLLMQADESDDLGDDWKLTALANQSFQIANDKSGAYVAQFTITPDNGGGTADSVTKVGKLKLAGNVIQASDGGATITLDTSDNVTVAGDLTITGSDVTIGADSDGTDRTVTFGHSTLKTIMGIDDSADTFIINTDASFDATVANNSLTIDASHNVGIAGDLTVYGRDITLGSDADGTDTIIVFGHSTLKSAIGIDDSQDVFAINTNATLDDTNDLEIDSSGNVTLSNGNLTVAGATTTAGLTSTSLITGSSIQSKGIISATGSLYAASLSGSGDLIVAKNTFVAGNFKTTGSISGSSIQVTGIVTGSSIQSSGLISATGSLYAGSLISGSGDLIVAKNAFVAGDLRATGSIYANVGLFLGGTSNAQTMSTVTLPANYNSVLYGPITIGSGETVRISAGSNVKIVDIANV